LQAYHRETALTRGYPKSSISVAASDRGRIFPLNEHFQIATVDPVMRVGVGLWGLNDTDISIKRPNQPRLLDGLVTILKDRGIGIHVSELERSSLMSVSGLSAQSLFSLACGDCRLKVNTGQYLLS
jgi:hypothetical protein